MKKHFLPFILTVLLHCSLLIANCQLSLAQNWDQIIKAVAGDRNTVSSAARTASDNYGHSVAVDGDYAIVGCYNEDEDATGGNTLTAAGAAYILFNNAGIWVQVKKIVAPVRATSDNFGYSVAISGNYVIVGAFQEDEDAAEGNNLSASGSAYIFNKDQGGADNWGLVQKITASTRAVNDQFGTSVAISGSYAIVGAYQDDEDAAEANFVSNSGSAYIFKKDQGGTDNWGQVQKITASTRAATDNFGVSVAISGSYAIVGAHNEDEDAAEGNNLAASGSAYIFKQDQGGEDNWGQVKKITASTRAGSDFFGWSVAISGNYAIVGAYQEDEDAAEGNNLTASGSAYIFKKDQGGEDNWGQVKKITASTRAGSDLFGYSVAISGNYAIVGAYQEDEDAAEGNNLTSSGSAYIFKQDQGGADNWGQVKKVTAPTRAGGDQFGYSVAISGNYAISGALQEDEDAAEANNVNGSGSAYIFKQDQGGADNWGQMQKTVMQDRANTDQFGYSVAVDGNYAIVGANLEDEDATGGNTVLDAGAAYIFFNNAGTWTQVKKITAPVRAISDNFGSSVAISGNYAIVGAFNEDEDAAEGNNMNNSGSAYIFKKDQGGANNWGLVKKITASARSFADLFGWSVAISGNYAIVGANAEDEDAAEGNTLTSSGSAYIFKKDQGGTDNWGQVKKITASTRATLDNFGYAVAISGNYAIVGAYQEDEDAAEANNLNSSGSAYIFKQDQGGADNWGQVKKVTASTRAANDIFGWSVAISGNYAIVGAYQEDEDAAEGNNLTSSGSAYIFKQDQGGADNWGQVKKITASTRSGADIFGYSVAISDNYAIVGANGEDEDATEGDPLTTSGSAYIFGRDQGGADNWGQVKKVTASTRAANDNFGWSVAISGNYALVGAYLEDEDAVEGNNLSSSGAAYFFGSCSSWSGTTSTAWHTATNWTNGMVPSASDNVCITDVANDPIVSTTGQEAFSITLSAGALLTVASTGDLTINGDLDNDGTLLVEADATGIGSLITQGTITGAGTFQAEQYLLGAGAATPNGVFQYVSSPVAGATSATYAAAGTDKLWSANEVTQSYTEITDNATALNVGQGYVARMGANGGVTFDGSAFNSGNVSLAGLSRTGNTELNRGYNLVGNPYPSSVNWNTASKTNLETTVWYRTHEQDLDMNTDTYNTTGNIGTNNNGNGAVTNIIPPTQAFWVRVAADGQTGQLDFDNADRSHQAWTSIYKQEEETGTVRLAISNGDISDETIVYFNSEAQDSYDDFDSQKMWMNNLPQLYTTAGEDSLTINGLFSIETNPIVDLGIKAPSAGDHTITASSIAMSEEVWLEDRLLNNFQHLNVNPVYAFTTDAGNIGDRFALHFGMMAVGIGRDAINRVSTVFAADRIVNVLVGEDVTTGTITILDMAGRMVQTAAISGSRTVVATDLNTGIYLVRVETAHGAETHRVLLW